MEGVGGGAGGPGGAVGASIPAALGSRRGVMVANVGKRARDQAPDERAITHGPRPPKHPDSTPASALRYEAHLLRSVTHPNVLRMLGFDDSGPSLVTEFCHGSLAELLRLDGPKLGAHARCDLAAQLCLGVMALHARRIVHYDLHTRNILIQCFGPVLVAKVADLGCARELQPGSEFALCRETRNAVRFPEVAAGLRVGNKACVTTALDVYCFGSDVAPSLFGASLEFLSHDGHSRAMVEMCLSDSPADRPTMHQLACAFSKAAKTSLST